MSVKFVVHFFLLKFNRFIAFLAFSVCLHHQVKSQSYLTGFGGMDLGFMSSGTFQNAVLDNRSSFFTGYDIGFGYRFRNIFSFEIEGSQNFENYRFQDKAFEKDYTAHSFIYNQKSAYLSYGVALSFYIPVSYSSFIYAKGSYNWYIDKAETVSESFEYEILKAGVEHNVLASTTFGSRPSAFIPEIGWQLQLNSGAYLSTGMLLKFGQPNIVSGQYELYDKADGELLRTDNFNAAGNLFAFNIRAVIPLYEFEKRVPKPNEEKIEPVDTSSNIIVKEDTKKEEKVKKPEPKADISHNEKGEPATINSRLVIKSKTVKVSADTIIIKVWDNGNQVDGDSISLNLNGEWILTGYRLKRKQLEIKVPLKKRSDNYLILYALNLGTAPPNTAAVIVYDGERQKILRLSSDMNTCGAINIVNR